MRPVGTPLYGRRTYESMAVWEVDPTLAVQSEPRADFARVRQAADKIVCSTTLHAVSTTRSRTERRSDPDPVRRLKASAASDVTVGGSTDVVVDGERVGVVGMNDTLESRVEPPRHTLQVRNGRRRAARNPSTPRRARSSPSDAEERGSCRSFWHPPSFPRWHGDSCAIEPASIGLEPTDVVSLHA